MSHILAPLSEVARVGVERPAEVRVVRLARRTPQDLPLLLFVGGLLGGINELLGRGALDDSIAESHDLFRLARAIVPFVVVSEENSNEAVKLELLEGVLEPIEALLLLLLAFFLLSGLGVDHYRYHKQVYLQLDERDGCALTLYD